MVQHRRKLFGLCFLGVPLNDRLAGVFSDGNVRILVTSAERLALVAGARSVSQYLERTSADRILSALPLSFDAGFSRLTTAFHDRRAPAAPCRKPCSGCCAPRCRRPSYWAV